MPPNPGVFSHFPRLLCLRGQEGTLACRVHDPLFTSILPQRSPRGRLKYAMLSEEKMGNLTAVRGAPGAGMVGPADYFCDLERSDQYSISIDISQEGIPIFNQHSLEEPYNVPGPSQVLEEAYVTKVKAQWFSGSRKEALREKMLEYRNQRHAVFSESLFPNSGILEIHGSKEIKW